MNAGGGNSTYYKWDSSWSGYSHKDDVDEWVSTKPSADTGFYQNKTGGNVYCVYDPATDKVWVTTEEDGLHDITVYVKDGTIRYESDGTLYSTATANWGTSSVSGTGVTIDNTAYDNHVRKATITAAQLRAGIDLNIKTVVSKSGYFVKGFAVNDGLTQGLVNQEFDDETGAELTGYSDYDKIHGKSGVEGGSPWNGFTLKLKGFVDDNIEVTPIYFKISANSNDTIRFYAEDFTGDVKND